LFSGFPVAWRGHQPRKKGENRAEAVPEETMAENPQSWQRTSPPPLKKHREPAAMAHTCNPNYLGGRDLENCG
jgi:hypothetical protein